MEHYICHSQIIQENCMCGKRDQVHTNGESESDGWIGYSVLFLPPACKFDVIFKPRVI